MIVWWHASRAERSRLRGAVPAAARRESSADRVGADVVSNVALACDRLTALCCPYVDPRDAIPRCSLTSRTGFSSDLRLRARAWCVSVCHAIRCVRARLAPGVGARWVVPWWDRDRATAAVRLSHFCAREICRIFRETRPRPRFHAPVSHVVWATGEPACKLYVAPPPLFCAQAPPFGRQLVR